MVKILMLYLRKKLFKTLFLELSSVSHDTHHMARSQPWTGLHITHMDHQFSFEISVRCPKGWSTQKHAQICKRYALVSCHHKWKDQAVGVCSLLQRASFHVIGDQLRDRRISFCFCFSLIQTVYWFLIHKSSLEFLSFTIQRIHDFAHFVDQF